MFACKVARLSRSRFISAGDGVSNQNPSSVTAIASATSAPPTHAVRQSAAFFMTVSAAALCSDCASAVFRTDHPCTSLSARSGELPVGSDGLLRRHFPTRKLRLDARGLDAELVVLTITAGDERACVRKTWSPHCSAAT